MRKRIISVLLLILLAASFMAPMSVSASEPESESASESATTSQKTIVEVTTYEGVIAVVWEFNKPVNALTRINDFFAGKVPGIPTERPYIVKLTLGKDLKQDSVISFAKNVTIDLNGHAIVRTRDGKKKKDGEVILVKSGVSLTITDSDPNGPGYDGVPGGVIAGGASTNTGGGIHVKSGGRLNMTGGTIYNCSTSKHGGAIYAEGMSYVTLDGATMYGCVTDQDSGPCNGGAIYVCDEATVSAENCVFYGNYAEDSGGAIFADGGQLNLVNDLFDSNRAHDYGGAIRIHDEMQDLVIKKCRFTDNECEEDNGGALYINDNIKGYRPIIINGCEFENNRAGNKGGAIFVNDHGVVLLDTTINNNTSKNDGGGVYVSDSYDINVSGKVVIRDNISEQKNSDNLCLEKDDGQAYIFNGGLLPGSEIWVSASKGDKVKIAKEDSFTAYQTQYIHADNGTIVAEATKVVDAPLIGTIAGKGSLVLIGAALIGLSLLAAAGLIFIMIKNRKGEALDDETDD